jgi:hypothetical protein
VTVVVCDRSPVRVTTTASSPADSAADGSSSKNCTPAGTGTDGETSADWMT